MVFSVNTNRILYPHINTSDILPDVFKFSDVKYRNDGLPVLGAPFFSYKKKLLGSLVSFVAS